MRFSFPALATTATIFSFSLGASAQLLNDYGLSTGSGDHTQLLVQDIPLDGDNQTPLFVGPFPLAVTTIQPLDPQALAAIEQDLISAAALGTCGVRRGLKPIGIDGDWDVMLSPEHPAAGDNIYLIAVNGSAGPTSSMIARPVNTELPLLGQSLNIHALVGIPSQAFDLDSGEAHVFALGSAGDNYGKSFRLSVQTDGDNTILDNEGLYFSVPDEEPPAEDGLLPDNIYTISNNNIALIASGETATVADGDNTATLSYPLMISTKGKKCYRGKVALQTEDPIFIPLAQTDVELKWCVNNGKVELQNAQYDFWAASPSLALTTWYIESAGRGAIWYQKNQTEVCTEGIGLYYNDNFLGSLVERIHVRHRVRLCGRSDGKFVYSWYHTPISSTGASHFVAGRFLSGDVDVEGPGILGAWRDSAL